MFEIWGVDMPEVWEMNSKDNKPPQFREVFVTLKNGDVVRAYYLKDINKYIRNVNGWRIIGNGKYIPDSEVILWRYILS